MSAINIYKRLTKFKITTAVPKKFSNKGFMTAVKVNLRSSGESNKLRYVYPYKVRRGNLHQEKGNSLYQKKKKKKKKKE